MGFISEGGVSRIDGGSSSDIRTLYASLVTQQQRISESQQELEQSQRDFKAAVAKQRDAWMTTKQEQPHILRAIAHHFFHDFEKRQPDGSIDGMLECLDALRGGTTAQVKEQLYDSRLQGLMDLSSQLYGRKGLSTVTLFNTPSYGSPKDQHLATNGFRMALLARDSDTSRGDAYGWYATRVVTCRVGPWVERKFRSDYREVTLESRNMKTVFFPSYLAQDASMLPHEVRFAGEKGVVQWSKDDARSCLQEDDLGTLLPGSVYDKMSEQLRRSREDTVTFRIKTGD